MLTKQGWRLVHFPNFLVARILRARYYPISDFLRAHQRNKSIIFLEKVNGGEECAQSRYTLEGGECNILNFLLC